MNNSSIDKDTLLEELNNEKATAMVPVIVYISVLMVVGLVGNAMVCVFYGCKTKQTSNTIFIVALAVFDLITCAISMPIEIVDLKLFFIFTNSGACKVMRFVNHFAAIGSAATLLAIASDRFRHLCRRSKTQLHPQQAKKMCLLAVGASVFFSWPVFIIYDSVTVDIKTDTGVDLQGSDCTTIRYDSFKTFQLILNGIHFMLFITSTVVLVVLYSLIGKELFRNNRRQQKYASDPISASKEDPGKIHSMADNNVINDSIFSLSDMTDAHSETTKTNISLENVRKGNVRGLAHNRPHDTKVVQSTILMIVITMVFVISFLPYLALVIWRTIIGGYEVDVLSDGELVGFQIGIRSVMLNSAINPLIYGLFNSMFRNFFYKSFCRWCPKTVVRGYQSSVSLNSR